MSVWEILGIAETSKVREIKRAYAKRLAECHPEDHPEEFKQLQAAYEQALALASGAQAGGVFPSAAGETASAETRRASGSNDEHLREIPSAEEAVEGKADRAARSGGSARHGLSVPSYEMPRVDAFAEGVPERDSSRYSYIADKLNRDEQRKDQAREFLSVLESCVAAKSGVDELFAGGAAYAYYSDIDFFSPSAAEILDPYVDSIPQRKAKLLQQAIGFDANDIALRNVFDRRKAKARNRLFATVCFVALTFEVVMKLGRMLAGD